MRRDELRLYVIRLGHEFGRLGMEAHVRRLRLYFVALDRDLTTDRRNGLELHWSEDLVVEWMKMLRLSPFEAAYPIRAGGADCPVCGPQPGPNGTVPGAVLGRTEATFPGGWKMVCARCEARWLVLDRT